MLLSVLMLSFAVKVALHLLFNSNKILQNLSVYP